MYIIDPLRHFVLETKLFFDLTVIVMDEVLVFCFKIFYFILYLAIMAHNLSIFLYSLFFVLIVIISLRVSFVLHTVH